MAAPKQRPKRVRRSTLEAQTELRDAAVKAALTIYQESGLPGLTMREVATRVGVTPMALYRYFTNKGELLRMLGEDALKELLIEIRQALAPLTGAQARVRAFTQVFIDFWEARPDLYWLVFFEGHNADVIVSGPALLETPASKELIELASEQLIDYAEALGAGPRHVAMARDLRLSIMLGYLESSLVHRRYPWQDQTGLREHIVELAVAASGSCLLGNPLTMAEGATAVVATKEKPPVRSRTRSIDPVRQD